MNTTNEPSNQLPESLSDRVPIPHTSKSRLVISLDSQVLSKIQTCGALAAYAHLDSIEPIDYENDSLDIGLVMHEGLAEFYRHKHNTPTNIAKSKAIAKIEVSSSAKPTLTASKINMMIDALSQYVLKYETEPWVVVKDTNGNPLVEQTFSKTLYQDEDIEIHYIGITDLIVRASEASKSIVPIDHKTYGSHYKPAILSNQFSGYMWATNSSNLIVNRVGVKSKLGSFERVLVTRTPAQTEEWKGNAIRSILSHLDDMQANDFRRNYEACTMYGGCRYLRLCAADPSHRRYLKANEYKIVPPWNPLEARD